MMSLWGYYQLGHYAILGSRPRAAIKLPVCMLSLVCAVVTECWGVCGVQN